MVIITERSFYFNRKCLRTFRRFCYGILGAVYQILVSCGVHQSPDTLAVSVRYPLICSRNASRSWCWPGAAAGFRQLWKWQQRKHGTPSADRGNKTAVMGMCVLAAADFCVNIIFSQSYRTANSFDSHSFHKMLRFPAVNQNTAWWVCSLWQIGEVGFQSLASDTLEE